MKPRAMRWLGGSLMAVGLAVLLGASCLLGYNLWQADRAANSAEAVLTQVKESTPEITTPEFPQSQPLSVPSTEEETETPMAEVEIDGHSYIGWVSIPSLELELPVMSQWSYPNLKISPCRYSGTAAGGDLILLAHNYPRHFGNLKNLIAGSDVLFTDVEGREYHYQVAEIQTLMGTDVDVLESGDWDLTLFTCTIGGVYRVTVRCEAVEE